MNAVSHLFGKSTPKDRSTFPALTDAEKAAILAKRKPTICPPVRVVQTFPQFLGRRNFA